MKASDLIKYEYGTAHGGAQHFSRIVGKEYVWNYVLRKGAKYEVTTDKSAAVGVVCKGKFYPIDTRWLLTNDPEALNATTTDPKFLDELHKALVDLGCTLSYVDHKLGCVGVDVKRGLTLQLFQSGKPDCIEIWKYSSPVYNNGEVYLKGPKVVPLKGAGKVLTKFGIKLPNLRKFQETSALKITAEDYSKLLHVIKLLPRDVVQKHKEKLKTDPKVMDVEKRFRWDLLWATKMSNWVSAVLYKYMDDKHLDSALKQVVKDLGYDKV
jgi:hypothetical protein